MMEYFASDSYTTAIISGSITTKFKYLRSLAKCIGKLHQLGVIHHDIKPQNFLYNMKNDEGRLIDFGLCIAV